MKYLSLLFLFLGAALWGEQFIADPSAAHFFSGPARRERVDTYDFQGEYPALTNIEIDAQRKKNVELYLTGTFPLLESLHYVGTFGACKAVLTGHFPHLAAVDFLCTSCAIQLDLSTAWQRSCTIHIRGEEKDITLILPRNVGIIVNTKTGPRGKVCAGPWLKKKGIFSVMRKTYENPLAKTAPIVLSLDIETSDGNIILK